MMRRKIGVALCVLGVLLAIFGVVWIAVIWPSLAKVPANLKQQVDLQGTLKLFDAGQHSEVTFDVVGHRKYTAVSATSDIVYLQEDVWFDIAGTDPPQEIESVRLQYLLGIDRVTRQNVEGRGDGIGGGHYNFPFNVSKDDAYPFWNEGNPENINCVFVDETTFRGLRVYIFEMSTPDGGLNTPAHFDTPAMTIEQTITLYVEPISGMPVYMEDHTKRSGLVPVPDKLFPNTNPLTYQEVTLMEDTLTFTDETVADLVSQAKSVKTQVALGKTLPWVSIGAGIVLIIAGGFLAARKTSRVAAPPESQVAGGTQSK